MIRSWAALILGVGLLSGCLSDRLSGTEVGNPEIAVTARIGFIGEDSLAAISSMEMMVKKMEYRMPDQSQGMIWNYPAGMEVDLAAPATAANLPMVKVASADWSSAEMMLSASSGDSTLPDAIPFAEFSNPRYVKLVKRMNGDSVRFLFELPGGMNLGLRFDAARLSRWRTADTVSIEVYFDCAKWLAAIADRPFRTRLDGEGRPYVLIGAGENEELHAIMKSLFPASFIADGAEFL